MVAELRLRSIRQPLAHWRSVPDPEQLGHFNTSTNRIASSFGSVLYDSAGNVTRQPNGLETMTYDAASRMNAYSDAGTPADNRTYGYDGDGRRVLATTVSSGDRTVHVYDAFGRLAAEYSETAPTGASGLQYRTTDSLGSTRLTTDATGAATAYYDFKPFGERIGSGVGGRTSLWGGDGGFQQQFTGKERDAETGLDYFGARYMSSAQGRFTSADAPFADQHIVDPQSWNLYTYARNNPLKFVDPTGRGAVSAGVKAAARTLERKLFDAARSRAVRQAWKQEQELVMRTGQGTREWTEAQMQELAKRGKVSGFEGHHINSVKGNDLAMAGNPSNIGFVEGRAGNLEAHGGDFHNETSGPLIDRIAKLGGSGLLVFFATFDQKMNEYASQSSIISSPDSWWSNVNPVNYLVENAALLEAFAAANAADREAKRQEDEERKKRGGGGN